jgi:hypothetical protein
MARGEGATLREKNLSLGVPTLHVMAGLVPAIHVFFAATL